jgi:Leucine-rich repeat (LRR) protein
LKHFLRLLHNLTTSSNHFFISIVYQHRLQSTRWLFFTLFIGLSQLGYCQTNTPPQPTPNTNQTATVGVAFSYTVNAFGDTETPNSLTYSASFLYDNGLRFNPDTRVISGTFVAVGRNIVTITATDPDGLSAKTIFTIFTPCDNPSPDYAALVELYNATNGSVWASNWFSSCNPCNWLECDNNGRVTGIYASSGLEGSIPPSIGQLSNLNYLHLQNGRLHGEIPTSIGNLTKLQGLWLFDNQLTGSIPESLGALTNLYDIELSNNHLTGNIPASLGMLPNLRALILNSNELSGSIPSSLGQLTKLFNLLLNNNQLTGSIPASLGQLTGLFGLNLSDNRLSGSIPGRLSMLGSQRNISIQLKNNQLSGCFLDSLTALCGKIDVSNNPGLPGGGDFNAFCTNGTGTCLPRPTKNLNQAAILGAPFSYTVNAFIDNVFPSSLTYTAGIVPINGFSFDPITRVISGTPTIEAISSVTITALNPDGLSATTSFTITACTPGPDYTALVDLYHATNGPGWVHKDNWLTTCDPCGWYGVACNNNGRVVGLYLDENQLSGSLPASLSALSNLVGLSLNSNQLTGSIPASIESLTNLESIELQNNQLSGSIPTDIGGLSHLVVLQLTSNQLSGSIPASLGQLTRLRILTLANNYLSGCFPAALSTLCAKYANFSNNSGLPGGGDFSSFCANGTGSCSAPQPVANANQTATQSIPFSYIVNAFTDLETPNSLTYSASIVPSNGFSFDATTRTISGAPINAGVSSVTITAIDPSGLSANTSFTITIACNTFSPDYAVLVDFYNATNGVNWSNKTKWLTGCDPCNWFGVTCTNGRVTALDLSGNLLSGSLPVSLSVLSALQTLHLDHNSLSGSIPASIGNLTNLKLLSLFNNQLSGSIPESLSALSSLQYLGLSRNQLSGSIPAGLAILTNLQQLYISYTQLSGSIPVNLGNLTNLTYMDLSNNQLNGGIPASFSGLTAIGILDLSNNQLSGCLPTSLSALCGSRLVSFYGNVNLPNGGDFYTFCANGTGSCSAPMPVNLVSFSAKAIDEQAIQLDWTTASEQNNKYFLLERSKDLIQVEPVANIKPHEGSSFQGFTYTFTDDKPYNGTSYYRLRQVDLDGKTTTYPWESVVLRREVYGVSPNPISNHQFRLQLDEPLTATIKLYSLDGRLVPFQKIGSEVDSLQLKTDQKLPVGVYILTVEERAQTREYRLVVE